MAHFSVKYSDKHQPLQLEPENNNLFDFLLETEERISLSRILLEGTAGAQHF